MWVCFPADPSFDLRLRVRLENRSSLIFIQQNLMFALQEPLGEDAVEEKVDVDLKQVPDAESQQIEATKQSERLRRQIHLEESTPRSSAASPVAPKQLFQSRSSENLDPQLPPAISSGPPASKGKAAATFTPNEEKIAEEFDLDKEDRTSIVFLRIASGTHTTCFVHAPQALMRAHEDRAATGLFGHQQAMDDRMP